MPTVTRIDPVTLQSMGRKLRTAAYCRVSSNSADQLNSYSAQVSYYTRAIKDRPDWEFVDVFADEGITGTKATVRPDFQRMIHMCNHNKIDLIITKSISRFARNVPECLEYARNLKRKGIGIIFEKEAINTLRMSDELMLSTFSAIAQEESVAISQRLKHFNRIRMSKGEYIAGHTPYGFRYDENKRLIPFEPEADIVREIYEKYLSGWSVREIACELEARRIPKSNGDYTWTYQTVIYILRNEKNAGNTLFQKNFNTDTFPFEKKKNRGELEQYFAENTHEGIISKETYNRAAALLKERTEYFGKPHPIGSYPLSKMLRCSECGAVFVRKTGKDAVYWVCHNHLRSKELCGAKRYTEDQIYNTFIRAISKLKYYQQDLLLRTLTQLDYIINRRRKNDTVMLQRHENIAVLMEKKHMLEELREKGYLADAVFHQQAREIDAKISDIRKEREAESETVLEHAYTELEELIRILDATPMPESFDSDLFRKTVVSAVVGDGNVRFTLKGGISVTERL